MGMFSFDRLAAAAALTAICCGGAAWASVKDGVDAWQARDYDKAVATWRGPAATGDADAQFNLGQAYKLGRGVPADMKMARGLYEKAAAQGHEQAQANLGLILFQAGERKAALPWIQKAAARGEPRAQYVLGTAHFNGDLAAKDWPRAYALMTRAAAAGLPQAQTSLAEMDKYIPVGQRQQGMALARTLAIDEAAAVTAVTAPAAPSPAASPTRAPAKATTVAAAAIEAPRPTPRPIPTPAPAPPVRAPAAATAATSATRAPAAAASSAAPGGWKVQLGAFGTPAAARAAWSEHAGLPGLAGHGPIVVNAGKVVRLQAGPFAGKAEAQRACAAATRAGKACFPVAP